MRSEWKKVKLGELCRKENETVNPQANTNTLYYHYSLPAFDNNKTPEKQLGRDIKSSKFLIRNNLILYNKLNIRFRRVWNLKSDIKENSICSTEFVPIKAEKIYSDFLYYLLVGDSFTNAMLGNVTGTSSSHQRISPEDIFNYEIELPPLEEQKAIADVLSALDDKIELNNKINKNLESQAQAIFKRWFVDFDFPDENGTPYRSSGGEMIDSELGEIPKGWSIEKLTSLCNVITKGTTPTTLKKAFTSFGINFIKAESISENHTFDRNKFNYIDDETNLLLKRSILKENDILVTIAGTIGRFAMVPKNLLPANTNQAIAILRINNAIFPVEYIYNFLLCGLQNEYFNSKTVQAVQANLSLSVIGEMPIIKPDMDCLSLYLDTIKPVLKLMFEHEEQNQKLAELRDYLLPKLMSGEIKIRCKE